jgi:hypothetical protein
LTSGIIFWGISDAPDRSDDMSPACIWASTWPGESVGEDVGDVGEVAELEAREVEGEELLFCELACVDRAEEDGAVLLLLCELVTGGDGAGLVDVDNEDLLL